MNEALVRETLEKLAKDFNTTVDYLIPRLQQYRMAMHLLGVGISLFFILMFIAVYSVFVFKPLIKQSYPDSDNILAGLATFVLLELIPTIVLIANLVNFVGWKYAPEIKTIEYVMELIK